MKLHDMRMKARRKKAFFIRTPETRKKFISRRGGRLGENGLPVRVWVPPGAEACIKNAQFPNIAGNCAHNDPFNLLSDVLIYSCAAGHAQHQVRELVVAEQCWD